MLTYTHHRMVGIRGGGTRYSGTLRTWGGPRLRMNASSRQAIRGKGCDTFSCTWVNRIFRVAPWLPTHYHNYNGTIFKGHNGENRGDEVNGSHLLSGGGCGAHTHTAPQTVSGQDCQTPGPHLAWRGCLSPNHSPKSLPPVGCIFMRLPFSRSAEV